MLETRSVITETRIMRPLFLLVVVLAAILGFDMIDGISFFNDIDDELRLLQIRHLLESGAWYDPSLPMIQSPEIYQSPWSRLVDLPYVVIALALRPFAGLEAGLWLATRIWPPVMLAGFAVLVVQIVLRVTPGSGLSNQTWLLLGMLLIIAAGEFSPGRIDHHNLQILLMAMILLGLVTPRGGGWLIGVGSTLSLVIGLECLPFVALALALVALAFVLRIEWGRAVLAQTGLSMVATSIVAGLLFVGPQGMASVACDAYSAPFIAAVCGYGACFIFAARMIPDAAPSWLRLVLLAGGGVMVTVLLAILFPACLAGPYHMIDPVSRLYWFDRILQEQNAFAFRQDGVTGLTMLLFLLFMATIAFFACPIWRPETRLDFRAWSGFLFAASSIVVTVALIRYVRFPVALLPLYMPLAMSVFTDLTRSKLGRIIAVMPLVTAGIMVGALYLLIPASPTREDSVWLMSADDCRGDDYVELDQLASGRIIAPTGLGLAIASHVPAGVSVAAIPFHRAAPGIRQSFTVFAMSDDTQRRAILANYDYVAVCHVPFELPVQEAPFFAALANSRSWPGLIPLPVKGEGRFRLFRIDHARLM